MLDEKDIQIISQLLDQKLSQQKQEIVGELRGEMDVRFTQQKQEIVGELRGEMDVRFTQQKQEIMEELRGEMDVRFAQQKQEIRGEMDTRFAQQKKEIMHEVNLLMESYFDPKFNALADGLEMLREKMVSREELEETAGRVDVLEAVYKAHSREIDELKKSNNIA